MLTTDVQAGLKPVSYTPVVSVVSTSASAATSTRSRRAVGMQSTRWYGFRGCMKTSSSSSYHESTASHPPDMPGAAGSGSPGTPVTSATGKA